MLIFRAAKVRFSFLNQQKSDAILLHKTFSVFFKKTGISGKITERSFWLIANT